MSGEGREEGRQEAGPGLWADGRVRRQFRDPSEGRATVGWVTWGPDPALPLAMGPHSCLAPTQPGLGKHQLGHEARGGPCLGPEGVPQPFFFSPSPLCLLSGSPALL